MSRCFVDNLCMRRVCSSLCLLPPSCFPCPCPPCPPTPPIPPTVENDILVAAGIGFDFSVLPMQSFLVPFGPTLFSRGESIRHFPDTPEFTILEAGEYQIFDQLSAYNPVLPSTFPIEVTVELVSSLTGTFDSYLITNQFQLVQRNRVIRLDVAETIFLRVSQPFLSEMLVNSQAITIVRLF